MIIYHNWFKIIYLSYLPVGHTHTEEVDGIFGNVANCKLTENIDDPVS